MDWLAISLNIQNKENISDENWDLSESGYFFQTEVI
jgi:hypothetical protein